MAGIGKESVMYQTIHRQPADLRRVLKNWDDPKHAAKALLHSRRIYIVGIGTSYHAALMGAWCLRSLGFDARAVSSFDLANYPQTFPLDSDDAVVVLSHSGAKRYSLAALDIAQRAQATVLSVGSLEAEHPGSSLILRTTKRERSAAFTSSHTTAMTVLGQVAVEAATIQGHADASVWREALFELPSQVDEILGHESDIDALADACVNEHTYVVGGGPSEATALEAVIKGREAAYVRIDGMGLEQFIHGPMICLEPEDKLILIGVDGPALSRNEEALRLFRTLGATTAIVGQSIAGETPAFTVPVTVEALSPILTTVPMQLLAWRMATKRGIDPDTFRTQEARFKEGVGGIAL